MINRQSEKINRISTNDNLTQEKKARLRAALQILMEHLVENGYLPESRSLLNKRCRPEHMITDTTSAPSENEI